MQDRRRVQSGAALRIVWSTFPVAPPHCWPKRKRKRGKKKEQDKKEGPAKRIENEV
jgi:hypothetical protein